MPFNRRINVSNLTSISDKLAQGIDILEKLCDIDKDSKSQSEQPANQVAYKLSPARQK